jgi:hypothetical protein
MFDAATQSVLLFEGGPPLAGRPVPDGADWSMTGAEFTTDDVISAHFTADRAADWIINRRDVFFGVPSRTGEYASGSDDVDAIWNTLPPGTVFQADLDGDGVDDVLVNEPGARMGNQQSTGKITLFLGPVLQPEALPTARPTAARSATPTATSTDRPPATGTATAATTTQPEGSTIHLPAALSQGP